MEFTQNLPPIRGGYVYKNNFFHVGGSKILVEMCSSFDKNKNVCSVCIRICIRVNAQTNI